MRKLILKLAIIYLVYLFSSTNLIAQEYPCGGNGGPRFFSAQELVETIGCCPEEYFYQNTDELPDYTFAKYITWGENVIPYAPKGKVSISTGSMKKFYAYGKMEIQPGNEIDNGLYEITHSCDNNFALTIHPDVHILSYPLPTFFSPNNDGDKDNFVIKANSVTFVSIAIGQQINGNIVPIYKKEFDVNANYIKLWDGFEGVQYGTGKNTTQFYYEFLLQNCSDSDIWRCGYITTIR